MSAEFVKNPLTGRAIRVGGATWSTLAESGHLSRRIAENGRLTRRAAGGQRVKKEDDVERVGGWRLKKRVRPIFRTNPKRKSPMESATDFTINTVRQGIDGALWIVTKSGKTRRWKRI